MTPRAASNESAAGLIAMVVIGIGLILGLYSLQYLCFVLLALVPAGAAALIEPRGQRTATIAIASVTASTLLPLVLGAMTSGLRRDLLTSGSAWAYVGGAVFGGMAIFLLLPAGTAWYEDRRARRRIADLRQRQKRLEDEWGTEVRTSVAR
jgi:hypothetical protein